MTPIDALIYAALAIGYVWVLALTERAAGRYVRGQTTVPRDRTVLIRTGHSSGASQLPAPACLPSVGPAPRRENAA